MNDPQLAKLATIRRCVQRIRDVTGGDAERVIDIDVQDIVVLNLQRAIQAAIDLAAHVISQHDWGLPDSLKAHFTILQRQKLIDPSLCKQLESMVGFRNIAVHDYEAIDVTILKRILAERLPDLENFAAAVTRFLEVDENKGNS
jgi:uncharacterized protein YutE (UPF0331/DUF86 family)